LGRVLRRARGEGGIDPVRAKAMEELDPQTGADPPQGLDGPSRNSFPGPNVGGRCRPDSAPNSHGESPGYSYLCRSGGACLDSDPVDRHQEFRLATKPGGDIEDLHVGSQVRPGSVEAENSESPTPLRHDVIASILGSLRRDDCGLRPDLARDRGAANFLAFED